MNNRGAIIFLDENYNGEGYCIVSPHNFLFLDTIACFDFYSQEAFRYNNRTFLQKLLRLEPYTWKYFETLGYKCIKIYISKQK